MRQGRWAYSVPFGLNVDFAGTSADATMFELSKLRIVPVLAEFNLTGTNPSGYRHLTSHASFSEILASGDGVALSSNGYLDFSSCDISTGSGISKTRVFLFRISELDCTTTRVHNMKVWASNTNDFLTPQNAKIVWEKHNTWKGNYSLPASPDACIVHFPSCRHKF